MKVKELIEILQQCNPDSKVKTDDIRLGKRNVVDVEKGAIANSLGDVVLIAE